MNSISVDRITPEMERASDFCRYALPAFDDKAINPLEALDTGVANCAVRAFVIATILKQSGETPGFFIHRKNPFGFFPHVMTLYRGSTIDTSDNPQAITIGPIKSNSRLYNDGFVIYGDPAIGLAHYVDANPELPQVPKQDMLDAREIIVANI